MHRVTGLRGGVGEAITLVSAGVILGAALIAGGQARAEKAEKIAPPLPPARVSWSQAVQEPRQVLVCGSFPEVEKRVNNLMLQGWKALPGTQAVLAQWQGGMPPVYSVILEWKPRMTAP